nr:hypothetical protein [Tanacetum cinerariifolium]
MVGLVVDEFAGPIVEVEEQMVALVMEMKGDLAMLFGDDDFCDDGPNDDEDDEEVWELVNKVSDAKVADGIVIGEIGPRVSAIEGHVQTLQVAGQHRDVQIQQLQTIVAEMSSREVQTSGSGISNLLAVAITFTGSRNLYC